MNKKLQYIHESFVTQHKDQTLSVETFLEKIQENSDIPVQHIFDDFARHKLTIIDKSGNETKIVTANLLFQELPGIADKYRAALAVKTMMPFLPKKGGKSSLAYTEKLIGSYAGKSPAEILINDPTQRVSLQRQITFFQRHAADPKYKEANERRIKAINEALELQDAGQLDADGVGTDEIVIFEKDKKVMRESADTKLEVSIKISCILGQNNAWNIRISNTPYKIKNGDLDREHPGTPRMSFMRLNDEEIAGMMYQMEALRRAYEDRAITGAVKFIQENKDYYRQK